MNRLDCIADIIRVTHCGPGTDGNLHWNDVPEDHRKHWLGVARLISDWLVFHNVWTCPSTPEELTRSEEESFMRMFAPGGTFST